MTPLGSEPEPGDLLADLMEGLMAEPEELQFRHGNQTGDREADRGADDDSLGERRVDHAPFTEPLL